MGMHEGVLGDPRSATTFPQLVRGAAAAYGDDTAIIFQDEDAPEESLTFRELDRRSALLARGLVARGAGKGSRLGFINGNNPIFAVTLAAILRIGAVAIPLSTLIKSNELVRVLRQSDVAGLIVQRTLLGRDYVERLCEALSELRERDNADLRIAKVEAYMNRVCAAAGSLKTAADVERIEAEIARLPPGAMPAAYLVHNPRPVSVAEKLYGTTTPSKATS